MADSQEKADPAAAGASVDGDLDPAVDTDFTTSKQLKEEEAEEAKKEKENGAKNLKSGLLISGVVVAVIGAIFAVVKNINKKA